MSHGNSIGRQAIATCITLVAIAGSFSCAAADISVIVVDHDMHFVRTLDSLITVFHQGAILLEGHAEKVLTDPSVREVYLGNRA